MSTSRQLLDEVFSYLIKSRESLKYYDLNIVPHFNPNHPLVNIDLDRQSTIDDQHRNQINGDNDRLVSRASNLLQNKSFTDVTFIVGPPSHSKKYVGHRVLLAMTSPVFEAMFYGDMADKSKVIRIPDLAPIGFENLLRYAYTGGVKL